MKPEQSEMPFLASVECEAALERFKRYHKSRSHIFKALLTEAKRMAVGAKIALCPHAVYWEARNRHGISCRREYLPAYVLLLETADSSLRFEHRGTRYCGARRLKP